MTEIYPNTNTNLEVTMIANDNKKLDITVEGVTYTREPIKTCLIEKQHNIAEVIHEYTKDHTQAGDIIFVSEKAVAITQERALPLKSIKPRKLAVFLSDHVTKTKAGIGLGMPETMEMALQECGVIRILFAAACGALFKLFKIKGVFYIIAGRKAASIDGPTANTIPPYNQYVVLGPKNPDQAAREIAALTGTQVAIVDINDLGGVILGVSSKSMNRSRIAAILKDNPLGQSREQTPCGIIRVKS